MADDGVVVVVVAVLGCVVVDDLDEVEVCDLLVVGAVRDGAVGLEEG